MKYITCLLLSAWFLVAMPGYSQGQVLGKRFELNAFGGIALFTKDLAKTEFDVFEDFPQLLQFTFAADLADQSMVGASVGYYLNKRFQVEGSIGWIPTKLNLKTGVKSMGASAGSVLSLSEDVDLFIYHGDLTINLLTNKSRLVPFLTFGGGAITYNLKAGNVTNFLGQLGGGLRIPINDLVGIRLQISDYLSSPSFYTVMTVETEVTDEQGQPQVFQQRIVKKAELFQHDLVFRAGICVFL